MPSVYRDERGEIHNVKVNNAHRINILYTKAGYMRSGDLHPNLQCDFVFAGKVKVWTLEKDGSTKIATYGKHEFISIPRGTPHVFAFVEDTIMAEWWEPQGFSVLVLQTDAGGCGSVQCRTRQRGEWREGEERTRGFETMQ